MVDVVKSGWGKRYVRGAVTITRRAVDLEGMTPEDLTHLVGLNLAGRQPSSAYTYANPGWLLEGAPPLSEVEFCREALRACVQWQRLLRRRLSGGVLSRWKKQVRLGESRTGQCEVSPVYGLLILQDRIYGSTGAWPLGGPR